MTQKSKKHRSDTKMVPLPSHSIVPERDINEIPVMETRHLGIEFGGLGNVLGSIISATFLTILPEVLREFADYRMLVYAVVLILVMIFTNNPLIRSLLNRVFTPVRKFLHRAFSSLAGLIRKLFHSKKTGSGGDAK